MNKEMQVFKNDLFQVGATLDDGSVLFDAETVAQSLGITDLKGGKSYVRWARVNEYLGENSPDVAKGDMIPEAMVYKLAFKASNETAEKFQDWLAIEVIPQIRKSGSFTLDTSKLSPELQLLNTMIQAMNKEALERKKLENAIIENREEIQGTQDELQGIRDVIEVKSLGNWRLTTNKLMAKIGFKTKEYDKVYEEVYKALDERGGFDLKRRLANKRARAMLAGVSKTKANAIGPLDIIEEDKKLIEIYVAIVKEMAIKKGVTI